MDNGVLTAVAAPGFAGALVSLRRGEYEYLNSTYPEATRRGWRNPWYGGIHPTYDRLWGGRMDRERFRARQVIRRGAQGLEWRGVRLTTRIREEVARGDTLFIEYLLAPGVDVLAVVCGRRDTLGEHRDGTVGFEVWSTLAPEPGRGRFHDARRPDITALAGPHWHGEMAWEWGGLEAADGHALFLGSGARDTTARGWSEGPEGCVLAGRLVRPLPAGGNVSAPFFLAPVISVQEGMARSPWSRFAELP